MNAQELVDSLFEGYEKTQVLADFKEELLGNLNAKIENLVKKGMDPEAAFAKASAELGDVSAFADELSFNKRKEVFEEAYMDIKNYMASGRVASYVIFGIVALFGITAACITLFATRKAELAESLNNVPFIVINGIKFPDTFDLTAFFAVMMPFLTAAVVGFTWLGVTQETASMYPVSRKRGAWYAAAAGLIAFGLLTMPVVFFSGKIAGAVVDGLSGATIPNFDNWATIVPTISMMIPFILPGIGILVYLVLTEKDRLKPWAKDFHKKAVEQEMAIWQDPATASRFGMFSGAIWIFAIGLFILLGFIIGFKFSWLIFIFAVGVQLLVQGLMSRKNCNVSTTE
ncbi:MAG: permease prefix domain 1-containing protein [Treponema sp.]|jgi:hypothetical protein|nr:permease prefix domain 1-containing protein [Treponema sp.]